VRGRTRDHGVKVTSDLGVNSDQARSRLAALTSLLNGDRRVALRRYASHLQMYPGDNEAMYEYACAQAIALPLLEAKEAVQRLANNGLDHKLGARMNLAMAYLRLRQESGADIEEELRRSVELDPSFALAQLSLGRHLLWVKRETAEAKAHLEHAAKLVPGAHGPKMDLMGLEAQSGNYRRSAQIGLRLIREHPLSATVWLGWLSAAVLASPLKGRLVILALVIALFFKHVALVVLVVWIGFAVFSLLRLRRVSTALAIYPSVILAVMVLAYGARSIFWGQIYP
jgi:tetratricopeptide (TPR) repeat protein